MPPHNRTVASLSQEIGVSEATLYNWKKQFRAKGYVVPKRSTIAEQGDAKAKLAAVIQTAAMNEAERKKSRALEKELRRKEKALAEAAALLTLSKKTQAIWGTNE